jgi:uncharacterized protein
VARFAVRLTPRGGSDGVDGVVAGVLRVRVRAAPVDGAANEALVALLAGALDLPRSAVVIERGLRGRRKVVRVDAPAGTLGAWPDLEIDDR